MRAVRGVDYRVRAESIQKAIGKATDGITRQRLESAASTCLTLAELIGWGERADPQSKELEQNKARGSG